MIANQSWPNPINICFFIYALVAIYKEYAIWCVRLSIINTSTAVWVVIFSLTLKFSSQALLIEVSLISTFMKIEKRMYDKLINELMKNKYFIVILDNWYPIALLDKR